MKLPDLFELNPYELNYLKKENILNSILFDLTRFHYNNCKEYRQILNAIEFNVKIECEYKKLPYLPVRLFKNLELKSIKFDDIIKTMTSSGTSGQTVSKIFLDKETAGNQTKVLTSIVSSFIGKKRMPMLIIDSETTIRNRNLFSARGAGIIGFSLFGSKKCFALDEKMNLNIDLVKNFINDNKNEKILIFGFTYMIWQHLYKELIKNNLKLNLENSILIHGGGWKKLNHENISNNLFKEKLLEQAGIINIHDYYGMVEQTGSIFFECEYGFLHSSIYSDIIIRRGFDFSEAFIGEKGIIQVLSILPKSYPGHSILTEDEGMVIGIDDCKCGRMGKYFKIFGRLKNAETRGCSDTYENKQ